MRGNRTRLARAAILGLATVAALALASGARAQEYEPSWRLVAFAQPSMNWFDDGTTSRNEWATAAGVDVGGWRPGKGSARGIEFGADLYTYVLAGEAGTTQWFAEPRFQLQLPFARPASGQPNVQLPHRAELGGSVRGSRLATNDDSRFDSVTAEVSASWRWLRPPLPQVQHEPFEAWRVVGSYSWEARDDVNRQGGSPAVARGSTVTSATAQVRWFPNWSLPQIDGSLYRRPRTTSSVFLTVTHQTDQGTGGEPVFRGWLGSLDWRHAWFNSVPNRMTLRLDVSGGLAQDIYRLPESGVGADESVRSFLHAAIKYPLKKKKFSISLGADYRSLASDEHLIQGTITFAWDRGDPYKYFARSAVFGTSEDDGASTSSPTTTTPPRPKVIQPIEPS